MDEVDVVAVAGSPDPGKAPELPELVGTALGVARLRPRARDARPRTYALLRFRAAAAATVSVTPDPLGVLRFGERFPSVDVLPAGR